MKRGNVAIAMKRLLDGDDGFTIVEIVAALFILTVGFFALASSMGIGSRVLTLSRQRQTATEVANAQIERLRNLSYSQVALSSAPAHDADPSYPDYHVSADGTKLDVSGDGTLLEPLIVDPSGGAVPHQDTQVGATGLDIYQYVTWVDNPQYAGTQDYRRVTVVVRFKQTAVAGISRFVRVSSFFTPNQVTLGGITPAPGAGTPLPNPSPSPSVTPSPSPSPSGPCTGDVSPPSGSFDIASSTGSATGYTASAAVTLSMSFSDPCAPVRVRFSNDGLTYGNDVVFDAQNPTIAWTLAAGEGTRQVWGKARDGVGNEAAASSRTVVLDTTRPTAPGTLGRTVGCSSSDRTVNLSWAASSDANLIGYRVYRSVNAGSFGVLSSPTGLSYADGHKKTLDSVRYYVKAYDKAGNESNATNTLDLAKNQCS